MRFQRLIVPGVFVFVTLVWAACAALGGDADAEPNPFLNAAEGVAYVGSEACASCHEDLYRSYQTHGMAQSFYRMSDSVAVEDFSGVVIQHPDGYAYRAYRNAEGRYVQEEMLMDPSGQQTHSLIRTIDWVVGSGTAARTYLSEVGGRLYELPLTWYTQGPNGGTSDGGADGQGADSGGQGGGGTGHWDFSPGYRESNGRFSRTIPPRCMACHNDVSPPVPHVEGAFQSVAEGIGCERCHGPGSLHVEARLASPEAPDSVDYTIVNPKWLELDRRLDVCQQCHLSGEVSLLRDTAAAFGYRPSEPLQRHEALFSLVDTDPNHVPVISHADRMRQSPCFLESAGAMDCTTCHNPHQGFRDSGPEYFNRTCRTCHAPAELQASMPTPQLREQHGPTAACFSCHMPKVEAADAPHASFTDHYIRVVRDDRVTGTAQADANGDLQPYFPEDGEGDEAPAYKAMAQIAYGRQTGNQTAVGRGADALQAALERTPELGEAQFLLGFARLQLGRAAEAVPSLERAVEMGPRTPERLNALAQAYEATRRPAAEVTALYERALQVQPRAADIRVNYGRYLEAQNRVNEALAQYARAAQDDPTLATAFYNEGTLYARTNRLAEAVPALRRAIALEPLNADALLNLGAIVGQQGSAAEAAGLFYRATLADPRNANAHGNLSMALAQQDQLEAAYQEAQIALSLDPNQAIARQVMQALTGP